MTRLALPRLAGAFVLGAQTLTVDRALACGATPSELYRLLPEDGRVDVPLNAALITASIFSPAHMVLRQVNGGVDGGTRADADAGTTASSDGVPLDIDCGNAGMNQGAVCIATPRDVLQPNTTYEWTAELLQGPEEALGGEVNMVRHFTTGSALAKNTFDPKAVHLELGQHSVNEHGNTCGIASSTAINGTVSELSRSVVLAIAQTSPQYKGPPLLISPQETFTFYQYNMVDCITPEVIDFSGRRHSLPKLCLDARDQPSDEARGDQDATAPTHFGNRDGGGVTTDARSGGQDAGASEPAAPPRLHGVDDAEVKPAASRGCTVAAARDHAASRTPSTWPFAVAAFVGLRRRRRAVRRRS